MVLLLVFMQLTRDLFAIAKFLSNNWSIVTKDQSVDSLGLYSIEANFLLSKKSINLSRIILTSRLSNLSQVVWRDAEHMAWFSLFWVIVLGRKVLSWYRHDEVRLTSLNEWMNEQYSEDHTASRIEFALMADHFIHVWLGILWDGFVETAKLLSWGFSCVKSTSSP